VRFITDKSFQYLYSGESTDEVIGEMKNVVDIKKNAGFQFMQTSCKSKVVMRQFLKYIKLPFIQYIYVEPSLIRCEYIIKKVKSDNPDPKLYFPPHTPLYRNINYKETLLNSDILVYNPYEDYTMILDFINEMCRNKDIVAIFISLYRVAKKSSIVESLITACDLNKDVYVFIEPTARGNEEDNLSNINILTSHGAHVACNYFNYKVHAKMCCAIDTNGIIYAHIGTGNYNEDTAKIYTDFHLLTTNVAITSEIFQLFQSLFKKTRYKAVSPTSFISASPTNFRTKIVSLIDNEREKGELGRIYLKCNSLCDGEIIDRLYNAAQAGVQINIICRTGCSITTHPNIIIKSKVGRFLEHDRIYIFGNRVFISSADLLLRNISKRLELLCEIQSFELKNKIFNAFLDMWNSKQIYVLLENGRWDRKMQSILERITL
jgi:polyphosphate kinase